MAAQDIFRTNSYGITWPSEHAFAITPNDDADLPFVTRGIYIGGAGNVRVTTLGGETVDYKNLAVGMTHEGRIKRVHATGTTATDIVGKW